MKGLIIKDLLTIVKQRYVQCIALLSVMLMSITLSDMSSILLMVPMLSTTLTTNTIQLDEISRFPNYAETMPVNKKQIVGAKYIFMITLALITAIPFTLCGGIILARNDLFTANTLILLFAAALIITILLASLGIPLYLRFGCALGNTLYLCLIGALVGFITAITAKIGFDLPQMLEKCMDILHNPLPWALLGVSGIGILTYLSYQIAYRLYQSKEA